MSINADLARQVRDFVRVDFSPHFGQRAEHFDSHPTWSRMREIGSELWLDTGNLDDAGALWTREFSALTTNNTLLNREVQTGAYDELIADAAELLADFGLGDRESILEAAFILNARHGLRLVEAFDAYVSVEEHTDLAHDLDAAVDTARRYHAICPERFIIKIPFTPAGLLATRTLAAEGIPVNHTLGFAARQNYLIARIGRPAFVNVFLGRLNALVANNDLGDGAYVGERTLLASQAIVRQLRDQQGIATRQIAASLRNGEQVRDLAGTDVLTMPPKAAQGLLDLGLQPEQLADHTGEDYRPCIATGVDTATLRLGTLWDVTAEFVACVEALEREDLDAMRPDDLVTFFHDNGQGDVFPRWTDEQHRHSADEGKIPNLDHWQHLLANKAIGLDALMNLAGLHSFTTDQAAMDARVASVIKKG
jgi:transaldolase